MIPLRDENPSHTVPFVTRTIIVLNALCFLYEVALGPQLRAFVFEWGFVPERVSLALGGLESPAAGLTVLTSMFLHGGWAHLLGNMWYLWIFGDNVEDRLGHAGFALFYLASGIVAAAAHHLTYPHSTIPTVGASGAIAGVLGAYLVAFPGARVQTLLPLFIVVQIVALPAVIVLGLWFVVQLFTGTLALGGGAAGGIAWWAHIGGFVFGMLVMQLAGGARKTRVWTE